MNNVLTRGCMTSKGRALFDMINGTGGVNRTISSFLPDRSEIQDKENLKTGRNNARDRGDIPPMIAHATQGRRQDTQGANGTDDTLVSAERNVGDNNDSLTLQGAEIQDDENRMTGSSRSMNGNLYRDDFWQYGSEDRRTHGLSAMQDRTDSGTNNEGQETMDWMWRTSLTDGILVSEHNLDGLQAGYSTIYDAMKKEYGGWDAARNAFPNIGMFLYDWGEEMAEFLLTKAPFPPHVKTAIAVGFFMKAVYDIVEEVCKKREGRIKKIKEQNPDWEQWEPWELEEKANESLDAWVIQAVGEKAIGAMLRNTAKEFDLNGVAQTALSTAWDRFVTEAKAGRWERRTR